MFSEALLNLWVPTDWSTLSGKPYDLKPLTRVQDDVKFKHGWFEGAEAFSGSQAWEDGHNCLESGLKITFVWTFHSVHESLTRGSCLGLNLPTFGILSQNKPLHILPSFRYPGHSNRKQTKSAAMLNFFFLLSYPYLRTKVPTTNKKGKTLVYMLAEATLFQTHLPGQRRKVPENIWDSSLLAALYWRPC